MIQERENTVTALPKYKSSCMTPGSIAICYILCMYIKEGNIQYLAHGNKPTLCVLLSSFRCSIWQLHMTRLCSDMVVSSLGTHLHLFLFSVTVRSLFKFTRARSPQECCLSDHRLTPGVDVPSSLSLCSTAQCAAGVLHTFMALQSFPTHKTPLCEGTSHLSS